MSFDFIVMASVVHTCVKYTNLESRMLQLQLLSTAPKLAVVNDKPKKNHTEISHSVFKAF